MNSDKNNIFEKVAFICGFLTLATGLMVLASWILGAADIFTLSVKYVPMAPNTSILFIIAGSLLAVLVCKAEARYINLVISAALAFGILLALFTVAEFIAGLHFSVDALFVRAAGTIGLIPIGRMSHITAVVFIIVYSALILLMRGSKKAVSLLGTSILFVGGVNMMGYLYGAPLLYGGTFVPVAFTTAFCFMVLGAGLISAAGPDVWPLKSMSGPSTQARLLRALLPIIFTVMLLGDLVSAVFFMPPDPRIVVASAGTLIFVIVILFAAVEHVSRIIGKAIDSSNEEKNKLQNQLVYAEKMSSIGNLAGGIAHELNNPMTTILGTAQMLLRDIAKENPLRKDLEGIESMAHRCRDVINSLLAYSYSKDLDFKKINAVEVFNKAILLMGKQMDLAGITILKPDTNINCEIRGIGFQLEQVFLNILINSYEAMPGGGILSISIAEDAGYYTITFTDTGNGIPHDIIDKIFDPFCTTKQRDGNMGLGLYIAAQIVERHSGHIRVKNRDSKGTEFTVFLPKE